MLQRAHLRSTVDQSSTVAVVVGGSSSYIAIGVGFTFVHPFSFSFR